MPIGGRSILETVVDHLANDGFTNLTFCVGYLSHLIRAVFDARPHPDVAITYLQEESALGGRASSSDRASERFLCAHER
jgi:NDP-sugar pyrophosphorylase family protein